MTHRVRRVLALFGERRDYTVEQVAEKAKASSPEGIALAEYWRVARLEMLRRAGSAR